jgi:hypothetical protein
LSISTEGDEFLVSKIDLVVLCFFSPSIHGAL